jgi:hypothetical protein
VEHDPRRSARPDRTHTVQRKQRLRQAMAGDRHKPPQPPLRPGLCLVGGRQRRQRTSDLSLVRGRVSSFLRPSASATTARSPELRPMEPSGSPPRASAAETSPSRCH